MSWLSFVLGAMVGSFIGVVMMCVFFVSGEQSRMEEGRRE